MFQLDHLSPTVLTGEVAVITGIGSGICKATTDVFTRCGATVVTADINYESVCALKDEFSTYADHIYPCKVDMSDCQSVESMIDYTVNTCGEMNILYNNAGIMDSMIPIDELSNERWNLSIKVKGAIINTASLGELCGGWHAIREPS